MFGIDVKILEDDTVAERMLPYTGGKPQQRHACIAVSLQGGGGFEIWQYSKRKPVPCPFTISVGDLGIFAAKLNCCNVAAFHKEISAKWQDCSVPEVCPDGQRFDMGDSSGHFTYIEDPDGTLIEFVETHKVSIVKKLGLAIDMSKRDPEKPLPKFLFRLMGLVMKQKIKE